MYIQLYMYVHRYIQTEMTSDLLTQLIDSTNGKQSEKNRKLDELQRVSI